MYLKLTSDKPSVRTKPIQQLARPPKETTSVPPEKWADLGPPLEQNARKPVDFAKMCVQTFMDDKYDMLFDPRSFPESLSQFFIHNYACFILLHRVTFLQSKFRSLKISIKILSIDYIYCITVGCLCYVTIFNQ